MRAPLDACMRIKGCFFYGSGSGKETKMVNFKENEELKTLNHSCAHVMAQAIKHLYPQAKFWVGPVVAEATMMWILEMMSSAMKISRRSKRK